MWLKIKKYIPEIIVIFVIIVLILLNVRSCNKSQNYEHELMEKLDSINQIKREDSTTISLLKETNESCVNTSLAKIEFYEKKMKSINRQIEQSKYLLIQLENQKKNIDTQLRNIDTSRLNSNQLIDFINKKY